jgi:hypothetical protein
LPLPSITRHSSDAVCAVLLHIDIQGIEFKNSGTYFTQELEDLTVVFTVDPICEDDQFKTEAAKVISCPGSFTSRATYIMLIGNGNDTHGAVRRAQNI